MKFLYNYTIFYLFLTFISALLTSMPIFSIFREGYLLLLFFMFILNLKNFKISKLSFYIIVFIFFCLISVIISPNKGDSISSFLLYTSGPIIFLLLSGLKITEKEYCILKKRINLLLFVFIITGLLLYPIQVQFYTFLGIDQTKNFINLFRFKADGSLVKRMSGLCMHPTTMGFVTLCFILISLLKGKTRTAIFSLIPFYLTNTRSVLFGIPFAVINNLKSKYKFLSYIFFSLFAGLGALFIFYNLNKIDPSSLIHFADLFIIGPKLILENLTPFGLGLGTMSPFTNEPLLTHVESDVYIALIQIGFLGFISYLILILKIGKTLKKDKNINSRYCYFLLLVVNIGCLCLSYYIIRFTTNYMWIELGLYFAYRRNLCK